jgi:hypothetical protein
VHVWKVGRDKKSALLVWLETFLTRTEKVSSLFLIKGKKILSVRLYIFVPIDTCKLKNSVNVNTFSNSSLFHLIESLIACSIDAKVDHGVGEGAPHVELQGQVVDPLQI